MDPRKLTLPLILVSVATGLLIANPPQLPAYSFDQTVDFQSLDSIVPGETGQNGKDGFNIGSAHDHALFYVVVNGSEMDFTDDRYQVNERYVHLESNNSNIVHKHAEGVTWKRFLLTINTSISSNGSTYCVESFNETRCGEGTLFLNNRFDPELGQEIKQGDKLVLIIGENHSERIPDYRGKQLPRAYKPQSSRGRRV